MKITLDHNCLINVANETSVGEQVRKIVNSRNAECFIVNIGASEMREKGIQPDRYDLFEDFLASIGFADLVRLNPVGVWDVTFWDRCVWSDDKIDKLLDKIEKILFPVALKNIKHSADSNSPLSKKHINRICDIQSLWCHINSGNDLFMTSDKNFMKESKLPALISLGAKAISQPGDIHA